MMNVGLVQLCSTSNVEQNLERCRALAREAAARGAEWVLFPENAPFMGADEDKLAHASALDGEVVEWYAQIARELGVWVTLGSFAERCADATRTYNTQVLLDPQGARQAVYRKIHLFDVALSDGQVFRESGSVAAGDEVVACDVGALRVGLSICYDLRFAELYRALSAMGAHVLTVPSAFTAQTGQAHWHALLQARAIENQCYVLAPDQWGNHYGRRMSYGQSVIYDPWGTRVACVSEGEGVAVASLSLEYLERVRAGLPCLTHRVLG
jgi:deaminated glutathione amidase